MDAEAGRGRGLRRGRNGRPIVAPARFDNANAGPPVAAAVAAAGPAVLGANQAGPADPIASLGNQIAALQQELAALRAAPPAVVPAVAPAVAPPAILVAPEPEAITPKLFLTIRKALQKYDGKLSYDVYYRAFEDVIRYYPGLTDQHKFELLSSALDGETVTLLEDLGENRTFQALDDALRVAYSRPIHAWTEMRDLASMKQSADETVEAWGTRVTRASRRAYPDTPAARVEEYAVQYFLSGLAEADVKAGVSSHPCTTMSQALEACRLVRSRLGPPSNLNTKLFSLHLFCATAHHFIIISFGNTN